MRPHNFFNTSDRDFYSKKNSVSQVYTYLPKIQKKLKNATIVDAQNALTCNPKCYYIFVFPNNLIWLIYYFVTQ
jgi:hypothetical protein